MSIEFLLIAIKAIEALMSFCDLFEESVLEKLCTLAFKNILLLVVSGNLDISNGFAIRLIPNSLRHLSFGTVAKLSQFCPCQQNSENFRTAFDNLLSEVKLTVLVFPNHCHNFSIFFQVRSFISLFYLQLENFANAF